MQYSISRKVATGSNWWASELPKITRQVTYLSLSPGLNWIILGFADGRLGCHGNGEMIVMTWWTRNIMTSYPFSHDHGSGKLP